MTSKFTLICHVLVVVVLMNIPNIILAQPQVPCYYIFGDSLVDSGNNNNLRTQAKANYPPYGVDFPQNVTGRFTNGRTIVDFLGELLGFLNFIPSYTRATNQEISTGVNYGSGASGIRDETGRQLGDNFSLDRQLLNHGAVVTRLLLLQRNKTFTNANLKKCIYIVNIGSNDYINNYLMPNNYPTSRLFTPDQYASVLIKQYREQLKTLYNFGARKIAVFGVGSLGCIPRYSTAAQPCDESINDVVKRFNDKIKPLVDELNNGLRDAKYTFINITNISAPEGGVFVPSVPCCQVRADGQCVQDSTPCPDRNQAFFYDLFHPTEIVNGFFALRSYTPFSPLDASPYGIRELAQL